MTQKPSTDTPGGVESGEAIPAVRRFAAAASDALALGVPREQLMTILADDIARRRPEPVEGANGDVVYDTLPDGLIDLPSAMRKYDIKRPTLWSWVAKGHLKSYGRLKGSATGGGLILVNEQDLVQYMQAPKPKGGRPKKLIETR